MSASTWTRIASATMAAEREAMQAVEQCFTALREKLQAIALSEDEESEDDNETDD